MLFMIAASYIFLYWNRVILRGSAFLGRGGRLSDHESYVTTEFFCNC
jgi:hypothetical protein